MPIITMKDHKGRVELPEGCEFEELLGGVDHHPVCTYCGELVPFDGLRDHLSTHRPDVSTLDTDQVRDCFVVRQ